MIIQRSNGKSLDQHPLGNPFDLNFDTYWKSSNPEEETLINNVVIAFPKTLSIDRIIYQAPIFEGIEGNGYPIELKVYYTKWYL